MRITTPLNWLQLGSTHTEAATHTFLGAVLMVSDPSQPVHAGSSLHRVSHTPIPYLSMVKNEPLEARRYTAI